MKNIICWIVGGIVGLALALVLAGSVYFYSLDLGAEPKGNPAATASDLAFVREGVRQPRGRILTVVSSAPRYDNARREGGYELTELARAYWVFVANGYTVDIASPLGGVPPQVLDEHLSDADYAFLNDTVAKRKLANTIPLDLVEPSQYDAVYFVGGKGTMFDFPGNTDIARIVRDIYPRGVLGAVCHGPAAFLGIELAEGVPLLKGKRVTGFSNAEELFLIKDARKVFPFLLQDSLSKQSMRFVEGPMYLDNVVVDGRLITGQNPWSTWSVAEAMVRSLGYEPVAREATREEVSMQLLATYKISGLDRALAQKRLASPYSKRVLLMYALVAAMQWRVGEAFELEQLARN